MLAQVIIHGQDKQDDTIQKENTYGKGQKINRG